jgi:hypothetical protein
MDKQAVNAATSSLFGNKSAVQGKMTTDQALTYSRCISRPKKKFEQRVVLLLKS